MWSYRHEDVSRLRGSPNMEQWAVRACEMACPCGAEEEWLARERCFRGNCTSQTSVYSLARKSGLVKALILCM